MLKLLTGGSIGSLSLKNRIIFPSMCHGYCDANGMLTERLEEYVRARAVSGVGMITLPGNPYGASSSARLALTEEKHLAGWRKLAAICHAQNCMLFVQLHPSTYHDERGDDLADRATDADIAFFIDGYANGAALAERAGLDGVEIHGAHAHEVAQFLSPYYNHRTDAYGGDYRGRARFASEVIRAIKRRSNLPVIFRISSSEKIEGGREVEETMRIAPLLEQAGADALHVSVGTPLSEAFISAPMDLPFAFNADEVAKVKSTVGIPVIAVDRIVTPEQAEEILTAGKADFVALGRAQLADPAFVQKLEQHRAYRPCLGCNQGCRSPYHKDILCAQNPRTGRESELVYEPVAEEQRGRKILIAGAGIAGLEAAIVLAQRGYRPVVFEKENRAGGAMRLAMQAPCKDAMWKMVTCRLAEAEELGVEIRYETPLTVQRAADEGADDVIVATGGLPNFMALEEKPSGRVILADDAFAMEAQGKRIAVLGGGLVGCEIAETLACRGNAVTIFEMAAEIAKGLSAFNKKYLFKRMAEAGVDVRLCTKVRRIELPGLSVESGTYAYRVGDFDEVVLAMGRHPDNALAAQIREQLPDVRVHVVGDAVKPLLAIDAVYSAALCASEL